MTAKRNYNQCNLPLLVYPDTLQIYDVRIPNKQPSGQSTKASSRGVVILQMARGADVNFAFTTYYFFRVTSRGVPPASSDKQNIKAASLFISLYIELYEVCHPPV